MGTFGRSISVTAWARQKQKKYQPIVGNCKRTTPAAVLFESEEYQGLGIEKTECWFPRSVLEDGESVKPGHDQINVDQNWIEKLQREFPTGGEP